MKRTIFLIALQIVAFAGIAQRGRFEAEVRYNVAVGFTSIPGVLVNAGESHPVFGNLKNEAGKPIGLNKAVQQTYSVVLGYNLSKVLVAQVSYNQGAIAGFQEVQNPTHSNCPGNYRAFLNNFNTYDLTFGADVLRMAGSLLASKGLGLNLNAGVAFVDNKVTTLRGDGRIKNYHFTCYASTLGTSVSMKISSSTTLKLGSILYFTDTYFLDGIHHDFKNDKLAMNYLGISTRF